jgi:hypothetical protein
VGSNISNSSSMDVAAAFTLQQQQERQVSLAAPAAVGLVPAASSSSGSIRRSPSACLASRCDSGMTEPDPVVPTVWTRAVEVASPALTHPVTPSGDRAPAAPAPLSEVQVGNGKQKSRKMKKVKGVLLQALGLTSLLGAGSSSAKEPSAPTPGSSSSSSKKSAIDKFSSSFKVGNQEKDTSTTTSSSSRFTLKLFVTSKQQESSSSSSKSYKLFSLKKDKQQQQQQGRSSASSQATAADSRGSSWGGAVSAELAGAVDQVGRTLGAAGAAVAGGAGAGCRRLAAASTRAVCRTGQVLSRGVGWVEGLWGEGVSAAKGVGAAAKGLSLGGCFRPAAALQPLM